MTGTTEWAGKGWLLAVTETAVQVSSPLGEQTVHGADAGTLDLRRIWFRWFLHHGQERIARLRALSASDAAAIGLAIRRLAVAPEISAAVQWHADVDRRIAEGERTARWIPSEAVAKLEKRRPVAGLADRVRAADCDATLTAEERGAIGFATADLTALVDDANERIMAGELQRRRRFFETIEKTPLTEEQARAVVCFDNRVQLVAAAGSGKTSVMVARAAYAVTRGFVPPERILLLAFNKAAAAELQDRVTTRFEAAGIDATGVRAATFHSFGLNVIGQATGRKPRLASWIGQGDDVRAVLEIVDALSDRSPQFRYRWDLYRLLFASAPTELDVHEPDGYDQATKETGYRTFQGDVVRSHGERMIADFLFLNGSTYQYERPYAVDVATPTHSQYRPDFYYPDVDVWHEHWALDRNGNPPAEFTGYREAMKWKRELHAKHGTKLVESTWADVVFGDGLRRLEKDLAQHGVVFDWNPDRPIPNRWHKPMDHPDLARLVRTFMAHVKSNNYTRDALEERLASDDFKGLRGTRTRLFLDLYWEIHDEWNARLAADGSVDFEDMLVNAADHLEHGDTDCPYDLVLVDEFLDASRARARLVRGLLAKPGRFLLAVGDDWQSINRFAGADISVMTDFDAWFGTSRQLALTKTFRCPQAICTVSSTFIQRNPAQMRKTMRSAHSSAGAPVRVLRAEDRVKAVADYLKRLDAAVADGTVEPSAGGRVSVDVLGRYGFQRDDVPRGRFENVRVTFRTVHGSKGLEADYIVVLGMTTGTYGFPSNVTDDPVLALALPEPESFAHAEERRLLYVAMTRARREVTLVTSVAQMSPFVIELMQTPGVIVEGGDGEPVIICSKCNQGTMVQRRGPRGLFRGCSTFPACKNTQPI